MFHFYWPWFALLFPLPFLFRKISLFRGNSISQEGHPLLYFPALQRLESAFGSSGSKQKTSNRVFLYTLSLVWSLLVFALMQPEKVEQFTHIKNKGYDLMLAVDISASMQALDFSTQTKRTSRLDATKEVVGNFVKGRQGDRVGLVAFGESAYLHVPLTQDTVSVSKMLNETTCGMAGNATAIGDAIGMSVRTLRECPEGSRVLVLLTDGEDNSSSIPPLEAAKLAKHYGIRIYTVGIGKNGLVPFPNQFGGYGMTQVSIDENLLKEIASMTGGQYFSATDKKILESIYDKINELEKTESNQVTFLIREPLYYYPLSFAMAILFFLSLYQFIDRRKVGGF